MDWKKEERAWDALSERERADFADWARSQPHTLPAEHPAERERAWLIWLTASIRAAEQKAGGTLTLAHKQRLVRSVTREFLLSYIAEQAADALTTLDEAIRLEQVRAQGFDEDPDGIFDVTEGQQEFDAAWARLVTEAGSEKAALRLIAFYGLDDMNCIVWDRRRGYVGIRGYLIES